MSRLNVDQIYTRTGTGSPAIREMPAFNAYLGSSQSVTSGTATKVEIDTVIYDTNSWFDTVNNRYTPQVAGYYWVSGTVRVSGTSMTQQAAYIFVTGQQTRTGEVARFATNATVHVVVSDLVYLNGSTDYVELYGVVTASSGATFSYASIPTSCGLQGFLVRPD